MSWRITTLAEVRLMPRPPAQWGEEREGEEEGEGGERGSQHNNGCLS